MHRNADTSAETIMVTGGAGFIGSAFIRHVLEHSSRHIVNLDALTYAGHVESLGTGLGNARVHFVHGDVRDESLLEDILATYRPLAIVHLAAESHVDRSIDAPELFVSVNVLGTQKLLAAAYRYWRVMSASDRSRFRFLNVSTDEVYGSLPPGMRSREDAPYAPNSPYAASKAAADHVARAYFRTFGLPAMTTHSSNNYGPRQYPEKLIPLMIAKALAGERLPVYGDGKNVRQWLFVEDHCRAIQRVLQRGKAGEVYNIGGTCELTNLDVVQTLCRILDELAMERVPLPCERLIEFVADRPGHDRRYALDSGKAHRELGWRATVSFEEGLRTTVAWYLENGQWLKDAGCGAEPTRRRGVLV